jgi:hypothetical protein
MPFELEWLYLDELVKLLDPAPDMAVVESIFRRALAEGALQDRDETPVEVWRQRFRIADGVIDLATGMMFVRWWDQRRHEWLTKPLRPQFRRADWLALFEVKKPARAKAVSKAEVTRWYRDRIDTWPKDKDPPSREEDEAAARDQFPGITVEGVRQARKDLAPGSWRARGRRKSKKPAEKLADEIG